MNQHIEKARHDYESKNIDFKQLLAWHLLHGVVLCWSDLFAFGFYSDSGEPMEPVLRHHADTLFVTYFTGDMRAGLSNFYQQFEYIAFQRSFKNSDKIRVLDMESFYLKL